MSDNMQIWKYEIALHDLLDGEVTIKMPYDAEILSVQLQRDEPCFWVLFNFKVLSAFDLVPRTFKLVGTGQEFRTYGLEYLVTVQDGSLVWHIFERVR